MRTTLPAAAAALLLAACNNASYIEIESTDVVLNRRGASKTLKAKAMDQRGHYYPEVLFEWESEKPAVATMDETGRVTAVSSGQTFVYARAGSLEARVSVQVNLVERIEIKDPVIELSLEKGERFAPTIVPYDLNGRAMNGRQVFLTAREDGIVQIDGKGGLWPNAIGEVIIDAEIEGKKGEIRVTVVK